MIKNYIGKVVNNYFSKEYRETGKLKWHTITKEDMKRISKIPRPPFPKVYKSKP